MTLWDKLVRFDQAATTQQAEVLCSQIDRQSLPVALEVSKTRAASQDVTLANLRSRTAALLTVSTLLVTFATSVGLLAGDTVSGGRRLDTWAAWVLVAFVALIAVIAIMTQWPHNWTFDSGTDVFAGVNLPEAQKLAFLKLEVGISRNTAQLHRLFQLFSVCTLLLGLEAAVLVADLLAPR